MHVASHDYPCNEWMPVLRRVAVDGADGADGRVAPAGGADGGADGALGGGVTPGGGCAARHEAATWSDINSMPHRTSSTSTHKHHVTTWAVINSYAQCMT